MGTPLRRLGLTIAALAAASTLFATPALAAPPASTSVSYAALGDSYAAGFGGGTPINPCAQSANAYPERLDGWAHVKLVDFGACSGATTSDVIADQVPALLDSGVRLVTLTVGGDDLGFVTLVQSCVDFQSTTCQDAIGTAEGLLMNGTITLRVATTIAAIRAYAPSARIVVTGYPLLFQLPSAKYGALAVQGDQLIAGLNAAIQAAASATGATYVDVTGIFSGHGIGSTVPWILDFTPATPNFDAFHPNANGYKAYTNALKPFLG